jgi:beta-glucanase (GH16 family)
MKTLPPLLVILLFVGSTLRAAPPPGYKLVWSDEFNAPALDTTKWSYRTGARLLSFQKPQNISVSNGLLRIALKKEDAGTLHYTAGGVISKRTFIYGYFEARFRCPRPAGWHTAFWTMLYSPPQPGKDYAELVSQGQVPIRPLQEIDICEQDSANNRSYSAGVIDWSRKSGKKSVGHGRVYYFDKSVPDFSAGFHIWGCEFTSAAVKFYLDGKLTHQTDATLFPHGPQNVWLTNVAVLWGSPKAKTPKQMDDSALPAYADFDWVRVYEK